MQIGSEELGLLGEIGVQHSLPPAQEGSTHFRVTISTHSQQLCHVQEAPFWAPRYQLQQKQTGICYQAYEVTLSWELPIMGHSPDCTGLPGHKEANKLQVHVESNVQEGIFCEEGILVKVGKEAEGRHRCQVTTSPV